MAKKIRTHRDRGGTYILEIRGWLDGRKGTYLWFGIVDNCIGTLSGQKLYRLAKAIVRQFEGSVPARKK